MIRGSTGKLGVALAAIALAASCAARRGAEVTYHDPQMDFSLIRNVAVMPFANLTTNTNAADRVRDVFMTMLQATGAVYVLPPGEVGRGISRASVANPVAPTAEEVQSIGKIVGADVVVTGSVLEYGEVRSGTVSSNAVAINVQMLETQTGRVVWSASSTRGGVSASDRIFGGGGEPMNDVTREAVRDLLDKLFGK